MSNQEERVNWVTVINFLEKEYTQSSIRQREWKYEREILTSRISSLEAELRSNAIICEDLVNRIKILQIALKEEKSKKGNGKTILDGQETASLMDKFKLNKQVEKQTHEDFLKELTKDLKFLQQDPQKLVDENLEETYKNINNHKKLNQKRKFGAHLDVVTAVIPLESTTENMFATASEDCLIKVWALPSALKEDCPQPLHTLRKHTGPLFSLAGGTNIHNKSEQLLFSGGIEGDIKSWRIDRSLAQWSGSWMNGSEEQQAIWQLQMRVDKLLSSSSDGFVRLFNISQDPKLQLTMLKQYKEKQFNHLAIKFINHQFFIASCSNAPRIQLWDVQGKVCQKFLYDTQKGKDYSLTQANKIDTNKDLKLVLGGCEDGFLRCFDYSSTKLVKKLETRTSITSILARDWQVIAGDHKGALHIWDTRTFKLIQTKESLHMQKYETGITSLARVNNYIISSGADGIVNIFN